jgi:hypothetical protein
MLRNLQSLLNALVHYGVAEFKVVELARYADVLLNILGRNALAVAWERDYHLLQLVAYL